MKTRYRRQGINHWTGDGWRLAQKRIFGTYRIILLLTHLPVWLQAQYPDIITMNHRMVGDAVVVARMEVVHSPGFEATSGLDYQAAIDHTFTGNGTAYDPPPTPGAITVNPSDLNYIITKTPQIAEFNPDSSNTCDKVTVEIQYFDGLGRNLQDVTVMGSPDQKDIIKAYSYDAVGRPDSVFLPFASAGQTNGQFDPAYASHQKTFIGSIYGTAEQNYGTSGYLYEASPLNRVLKQSAPGVDWAFNSNPGQEHIMAFEYGTNQSAVNGWICSNDAISAISWNAGQLFVKTSENENAAQNRTITREYKDKSDRLVMVETFDGNTSLRTIYVYDDLGLLRCVVPPKASQPTLSFQIPMQDICYYYRYDGRRRMVMKKLPEADSVLMIYDKRDRLVMSQDGKMRTENPKNWLMTCYDNLNRSVMTGIYQHPSAKTRVQMQSLYEGITNFNENLNGNYNDTEHGYTRNVATALGGGSGAFDVQTVSYYDNYDFAGSLYGFVPVTGIVTAADTLKLPRNQLTGSKTKVLPGGSNWRSWKIQAYYYDDKYRIVQTTGDNQCSDTTKDIVSTKYSFTGRVESKRTRHRAFGKTIGYTEHYRYDHMGRLLEKTLEGLPGQPSILVNSNHYDRAGQLVRQQVHSVMEGGTYLPFIQQTDFSYNIRGWLTGINDPAIPAEKDIFTLRLLYNQAASGISTSLQYNGNISALWWGTDRDPALRAYSFSYDSLNRLRNAQHYRLGDESWISDNSYSEKNITYDPNGNITKLARYAANAALIDNLTYGYPDNGNQISYVKDTQGDVPGVIDYPGNSSTTVDFSYDRNGNMIIDRDKGINTPIHYSYLNKPEQIEFGNGEKIFYLYDGIGTKQGMKVVKDNAIQSESMIYIGNFVYNWNGKLQYILTDEGRLVPDSATYLAEYFLKDHLGNTRAVYAYAAPGLPQVEEYQHYYPFGMQLEGLCHTSGVDVSNKQLYNGKELQTEYGLEWYDYGNRMYDSQLGRWHVIDRFAEKFINASPYCYALNNPVANIDINGDTTYRFDNSAGAYLGMYDLDAAGQRGSYGATKTIGKGKDKQEVWDGQYFDFADPVNDAQDIRDGIITKLVLVSEEDMQSLINEQGAFESGKLNFGWQSQGGGDFDYSYTALPKKYPDANFDRNTMKSNSLFLPEGDNTAHNFMNFGNYLWGATGYTVGFNYTGLQAGAHANSLFNPRRNCYPAQWDSKDDQRSIVKGIYHAQIHDYRKLRK